MLARHEREARRAHLLAEMRAVRAHALAQARALVAREQFEHFQRCGRDARRQRVREQIGTRALPQQLDDLAPRGHVTARRAAQRLAERARDDVDAALDAAILQGAAPVLADEADGVRIVDHHERAVAVGQIAHALQVRDDAVHREYAVGRDQLEARARRVGFAQLRLEIGEVVVLVAKAPGLRQTNAVDDARVIQLVADDRVVFVEQRLEQAAVSVEAARIQNAIVGLQERGQRCLELLVHGLRAADEAHRGHPEPVLLERRLRGGDEARIVREPQVVVRAKIQHVRAAGQPDVGRLRARDLAFGLVETVRANLLEGAA